LTFITFPKYDIQKKLNIREGLLVAADSIGQRNTLFKVVVQLNVAIAIVIRTVDVQIELDSA
jgi:hypothetical protein